MPLNSSQNVPELCVSLDASQYLPKKETTTHYGRCSLALEPGQGVEERHEAPKISSIGHWQLFPIECLASKFWFSIHAKTSELFVERVAEKYFFPHAATFSSS